MKRFFSVLTMNILIFFILTGCSLSTFTTGGSLNDNRNTDATSDAALQSILSLTEATVISHVDGDTVYVRFQDGSEFKLRLIGVDTPETVHPTKAVEYFGEEASEFTKNSLLGKTVYLEKDISETDQYGRLLRYVWLEPPIELSPSEINSKLFNAILVASGYAQVSTYPPDVKYQDHLLSLQREARENARGLWNENPLVPQTDNTVEISTVYIGNANTYKFHNADCNSVGDMAEKNKRNLANWDEAITQGYIPCKICDP